MNVANTLASLNITKVGLLTVKGYGKWPQEIWAGGIKFRRYNKEA